MKKSAVFFDIDGTIWDYHHTIPQSTIDAIHQLQANGHYAFINSGRSRATIQDPVLLDIGFDGIVAGCGTYIEYKDKVLLNELLSWEQVDKAMKIMKENKIGAFYEGSEILYIDWSFFAGQPYAESFRTELKNNCQGIECIDSSSKINKMSIDFCDTTREKMLAALKSYHVIVHESDPMDDADEVTIAEIIPTGFSKATGIQWICDHLDVDINDTYSFGDSANDIDMLRYAGCGIAMGNGVEVAKKAANIVTTDMFNDGIYNGLKQVGLI